MPSGHSGSRSLAWVASAGLLLLGAACGPRPSALSEQAARTRACQIANDYLATHPVDAGPGAAPAPGSIQPPFWLAAEYTKGRWQLSHDPPSGFFMAVSFEADGSSPRVDRAGYAAY